MFSLETLSDNKNDKNGRIDGRFSLLTLAFQAKHGVKLLCGDYVQLLIIKVDFESGLEEIANLLRRSTRRLHLPESTRKVRGECHFSYRYESPKKS